jgi:phosphoribosylcarboxyaminoimidazole (NCAIR) mutase
VHLWAAYICAGMVAALTPLPVIGVPVKGSSTDGLDSLLSIVQVFWNTPWPVADNHVVSSLVILALLLYR